MFDKSKPDVGIIFFSSIYKSLSVCNTIKTLSLPIRPIIFSNINNNKFAYLSLYAGASGYISTNSSPAEILHAIKQVYQGNNYFGTRMNKKLPSQLQREYKLELESIFRMENATLTKREGEILSQVSLGYTSKEIATNLNISKRTVDNLRARIIDKLGVSSMSAVIGFAIMSSIF